MKYWIYFFIAWVQLSVGFDRTTSAQTVPQSPYWPTDGWRTTTPESQGLDSEELVKAFDFIRENKINIHSMLIIRNGYVVLDAIFYPYTRGTVHDLASVTKSVTSALIGIAIDKGVIQSVHHPILDFFPEYEVENLDENKRKITIEDLLTMTSGFNCGFQHGEQELFQMFESDDWIDFVLDMPMTAEPGSRWAYCSPNVHLLSAIISKTTGMSALEFARKYLFDPLGIKEIIWPSDPNGFCFGWGDLHLLPEDMAKIGTLYLNEGLWDGKQVISSEWIAQSKPHHVTLSGGRGYGYLWWDTGHTPGFYEAVGRGGQRICIWPEKRFVIVFTGGGFEPGDVGRFIGSAYKSDTPLPENPEGIRLLREKVKVTAKAPNPKPISSLSEIAENISEKTYVFDANSRGLRSISLSFPEQDEVIVKIHFRDGRHETRPIGLDDVYRVSPEGRFGLPVALKGVWKSENEFVFYYNEVANINNNRVRMLFEEDRVQISISEETGLFDTVIDGRLEK